MLRRQPSAAITGLGAGVSKELQFTYEHATNTPIKIAIDQGFPALLIYFLLFVVGKRTRIQAVLTVPACVLFFLTGSYEEFPPMIFMVLLLIAVARLRPAELTLLSTASQVRSSFFPHAQRRSV